MTHKKSKNDDDPNRTARLRTGSPTQPALHLPLSQGYHAILDINWSKSSYAKVCAFNGMREFLLKRIK